MVGQTPTTDGVIFNSREATTNRPQLVATTGAAAAAAAADAGAVPRVARRVALPAAQSRPLTAAGRLGSLP